MSGIRIGGTLIPGCVPQMPFLGTYFDSGSGFNMNYMGVLTITPGQDPTALTTPTANFAFTPQAEPNNGLKIIWKQQGALYITDCGAAPGDEQNIRPSTDGTIYAPRWNPSGADIVYVRSRSDGGVNPDVVCKIDPAGASETILYTAPALGTYLGDADYNFDGTKIVFTQRVSDTVTALYAMNADGSSPTQIETIPTQLGIIRFDSPPFAWLRTASRLIFNNGTFASPNWTVMNDDGTSQISLITGSYGTPHKEGVQPDDSAILWRLGNDINSIAMDGSGASLFVTPTLPPTTNNVFIDRTDTRVYFDVGDDIYSVRRSDAGGERNEGGSTTDNLGLTG